jgi:hypothetical protein
VFSEKFDISAVVNELIKLKKVKTAEVLSEKGRSHHFGSGDNSNVMHEGGQEDEGAISQAMEYHMSIPGEDESNNSQSEFMDDSEGPAKSVPHIDSDDDATMLRVRVQSPGATSRRFVQDTNSPSWLRGQGQLQAHASPSRKVGFLKPISHVSPLKNIDSRDTATAVLTSETSRKPPALRSLAITFADDDAPGASSPSLNKKAGRKSPSRQSGATSPSKKGSVGPSRGGAESPSRRGAAPDKRQKSHSHSTSKLPAEQSHAEDSSIAAVPPQNRKGSLLVLPSALNFAGKISVNTRIEKFENRVVATSAINPGLHLVLDPEDQKKIARRKPGGQR